MPLIIWEDPGKKTVNKDLYSNEAEKLAKTVCEEYKGSREKHNKPAQIRKFYDELLRYKDLIKGDSQNFQKFLPFIRMIKAKSAYSYGRDLIGQNFKNILDEGIDYASKSLEALNAFINFFEAFLGYYKFYIEAEKLNRRSS